MVGRDPFLMEARKRALQEAGYTVVSSLPPEQPIEQFLPGNFDLVILCHSIPTEERTRLAGRIREHSRRTPIVCLSAKPDRNVAFIDATSETDTRSISGISELLSGSDQE
jgi:DNA-binding response OmpR family regulator